MSESKELPAWASTAVADLLGGEAQPATVFAANASASYLSFAAPGTSSRILALLSRQAVRLPMGVVVGGPLPESGSAVLVGEGSIIADSRSWKPARWWDPRPRVSAEDLVSHAPRLLEVVEDRPSSSFGFPLADALSVAEALAMGDPGPALAVIGLGPGLTPAADDVVAGSMAILALVGQLEERVAHEIVTRASTRTTALSAALLAAASRGQVIPQVVGVLTVLAAGGSLSRLEYAAAELFCVGATSGHALCAGMAGALARAAKCTSEPAGAPATTTRSPR